MTETIGQIIRRLRKERNLTQEELAEQLNISAPAVSKWENDTTMPDISQIVPLANIFGVSTDVLFGVDGTTANEEALEIVEKAYQVREHGNSNTYLKAYDLLSDGLKKYPNNLILLQHCAEWGLALSLPENGQCVAGERAQEIVNDTIRRANFIISHSQNISDILRARQILVLLYSSQGYFDKATTEARNFPVRSDFTLSSNMARVNEFMGNRPREIAYLCSDMGYLLQALEDNAARLGTAYHQNGQYREAIAVFEAVFDIMKAVFKEERPAPFHDFDSGDCYLLLARSYLALGETNKALDMLEESVMFYLNQYESMSENRTRFQTPLLRESEVLSPMKLPQKALKEKLFEKLHAKEIEALKETERYQELCEKVSLADI